MEVPSREEALERLVALALAEDLGPGDLTSQATVPRDAHARARIIQKEEGVISGLDAVGEVYRQLGTVSVRPRPSPDVVAELNGNAHEVLAGERVALNFLGHLSGVATLAARFVEQAAGTGVRILDTRKTTPGMRRLEKEAVADGGGVNHRTGLFDAILIKENHVTLSGGIASAIAASRELVADRDRGDGLRPVIQVECESLDQLRDAIESGADRILLDNMTLNELRQAVEVRNSALATEIALAERSDEGEPILLEASGGVTLQNVRQIAETGVDLISIGAITHSAPALDLTMLVEVDS